ncbi:hypothetical protein GCM10023340_08470 [Nocardioides marinquilinus]|uniref:Head-to-tail adaptor n=1 Tax=Nocardioides marinquilinus TaxID=1210400 RepID=A0ABP9PAD2_9ACTN
MAQQGETPEIVKTSDLPEQMQGAELIDDLVAGANAKAARVAPCLASTEPGPGAGQLAEAKLILLGAIKRWAEAGAGSVQQQSAGPFSTTVDTRQRTGYNLWPSEIRDLQDLCKSADDQTRQAFTVDTAPGGALHSPVCSVYFGAGTTCSCGASIAGQPLYEQVEP